MALALAGTRLYNARVYVGSLRRANVPPLLWKLHVRGEYGAARLPTSFGNRFLGIIHRVTKAFVACAFNVPQKVFDPALDASNHLAVVPFTFLYDTRAVVHRL